MAPSVNPEPFRKFSEFVGDTKLRHTGRDIAGNPKNYVPLSSLREYWTPSRVSRVLHAFSGDRLDIDVATIRRQYLRTFSTLVYTGPDAVRNLQPLFISLNLTDNSLPWPSRPSAWRDEKFFCDFFKAIRANQWQFFPLDFRSDQLQDRFVDDECILPIDPTVQIAHSNTTVIERFDIHPEFNYLGLDEQGGLTKTTFVFKVYHYQRYEEYYENELRALRRLSVHPSENVVKFYGSFRQLGSYCLILEYVDGGDLGEFFDNGPPPSTFGDVVLFWKNLFQVFSGLDRIHQLMSYNEDEVIRGIHEDIRPENILLMKGPSGSRYDFTPKIADFGLYSRVRTAKARASGSMGLDHYGNQRFSSPECCHHTTQRHKGSNMITTSADIFSMGAVLSHAAAWVIGGLDEQRAYFRSRKSYHATKHPRFLDSGYEGCFHDSIEPLPVVKQHHDKFRERCKASNDGVTPEVLNWVEECMLVRTPKDRLRARVVLEKFDQLMDHRISTPPPLASPATEPPTGASETTQLSPLWSEQASPSTVDGASPPPTTPPAANPQPVCRPPLQSKAPPTGPDAVESAGLPQLQWGGSSSTVRDANSTPVDTPRDSRVLSPLQTQQATSPSTSPSPVTTIRPRIDDIHKFHFERGQNADHATAHLVEYLEDNLGGRDQFFFIDDSRSMLHDKATISKGFCALACIAQRLDPNQVELAFASRPRKVYRARRTKRLQKLVEGCKYRGDGHLMESRIGELIDNVIIPRLPYRVFGLNVNIFARKKVSIYVFTDGDWGDARNSGDACGVERPVQRLIQELKRRRLDRTQVSLHFVRFGFKENGRLHLDRLDECGRDDMDIVDVKHINTEVEGMFIGPLTRGNDDKASEAS